MLDEGLLNAVIERLQQDSAVEALWLFGSEASGRATSGSDVDLAILLPRPASPEELLTIRELVERIARREVDVVDLRSASPILGMQVLRTGRLLFDRNPSSRARFVASLPSRRYDLLRVRRDAERHLLERMHRGRA